MSLLYKELFLFLASKIFKRILTNNVYCELSPGWLSHRVISDKIHRLFVTLSYFRLDRFVQLLSLIPILILLLYFLVSINLVYADIVAKLEARKSKCLLI